jgi:hypothetical protein
MLTAGGLLVTQRRSLINPYLILQIGMFVTVIAMAIVVIMSTAHAETKKKTVVKKTTTTTTTTDIDTGDDDDGDDQAAADTSDRPTESELTATFGAQATTGYAGCKTEELAKAAIKELKSDCNAWIKDQKTDLKANYRTGVCEEKCSDCQAGLRRCNVVGTIRYMK